MAIWKCTKCGSEKEGRCRPKKCSACQSADIVKQQ